MPRIFLFLLLSVLLHCGCYAQLHTGLINKKTNIKINGRAKKQFIKRSQQHQFELQLSKDEFYNILIEQSGIDVVVYLKDEAGHILEEKDSPTGRIGVEKISFSPDVSGKYMVTIKPLDEIENTTEGQYDICVLTAPGRLRTYRLSQVQEDFDMIRNAYIETKVGLWYNSYVRFDSLCRVQRNKLRDKMTALDFYKVVAPVTSFTKEGHSSITISDEINDYFKKMGTWLPFVFKILDRKIYILNDYGSYTTKGLLVNKINGMDADSLLQSFEQLEPSDGYNITSKHRWIESAFSKYYLRLFGGAASYKIEFKNPTTQHTFFADIPSLKYKEYINFRKDFYSKNPDYSFSKPAEFIIDSVSRIAYLTINDFGSGNYKGKSGFQHYLDGFFTILIEQKIQNLVIDIRKNEGGNQGMEDILLSFLIDRDYIKYNYVEIPSYNYSFLQHTNYKDRHMVLKKELSEDFFLNNDGRYLNKPDHYQGLHPNKLHFDGKLYVLIGGLTFSGGSEFAALAKNHTKAIFIGEETGGGYYGNTSGMFINFTLPHTKLTGRIPLLKFTLQVSHNTNPYGHGLMPDYFIQPTISQYLSRQDVEIEYAKMLMVRD
jgi:hypothetical protein